MKMRVFIQMLQKDDTVQTALHRDGWQLKADDASGEVRANHPHISDERVARHRLNDLGLLTCRTCRIEFMP
jgi:hypothetical protein